MASLSTSTTTLAISLAILSPCTPPQAFHDVCYRMQEKQELLAGISEFLDEVRSRLLFYFRISKKNGSVSKN